MIQDRIDQPHISSVFVRGFARDLRPINHGVAWDLNVIADQFDFYLNGYFDYKARMEPFLQKEAEYRFVELYLEYNSAIT